MLGYLILVILLASVLGYSLNYYTARSLTASGARLHSLATFHGAFAICLSGLPAFVFVLLWLLANDTIIQAIVVAALPADRVAGLDAGQLSLIKSEIQSLSAGNVFGTPEPFMIEAAKSMANLRATAWVALFACVIAILIAGMLIARAKVSAHFRARQSVERVLSGFMIFCSLVAILTTLGIISSLIYESLRFFAKVPINEFLFGLNWEPQIPIRADQVAGIGAFGWLPVFVGTLVITVLAMIVAIPIGIYSAIYLNEFASPRTRAVTKPMLELLAGVPTIVYGFFAILVVAPALRSAGNAIGVDVAPNTALAAGGVMGIMLIPFISSFTDDALNAVPRSLRDGSLALGATRGETMLKVLFPAAIPGIVGGVLLAVSRAIGETMIVVMAAGLIARMTINPLDSVTTVTVQIVTLLIGDTEFDNPKTLAAFALGLMLFLVTLVLNIVALRVVRKYRELYD
ncbi:MAG TPA: phosphate ABC transporter permease subunit PstC [Thermohalobaculum sp.]|nr:phosphate ABC transporter permease subunit PstC [Thermohalobaculum sp.]